MPEHQPQLDFDNATKRVMLTRLDKALQRSGISFGEGDPKNKLSARTLYNVLQAIHGWSVKTGRTDKPAGKLAPSISLRVARRAIAVLRSEAACCVLAIEDDRRDGAPVQWKSICWPNVVEWVEQLGQIVPPAKKPRTRVPVNQDQGAGETQTRVPDRHGDGCRTGTDMGAGAAPCLYSNEFRRSLSNDEGERVSECSSDFETTETGRNGDAGSEPGIQQQLKRVERRGMGCGQTVSREIDDTQPDDCLQGKLCDVPKGRRDLSTDQNRFAFAPSTAWPDRIRSELTCHQPSSLIPQRSSPMPTRTIDPREQTVVERLIALDVGSARATLRESLRIGYTIEAITGILDWYESLILVDPETNQRVIPYWPGSIVIRLRDEDARKAEPSQGKWGGKRAEWTALKARLTDPKPAAGRVPDYPLARRAGVIEALNREQVESVLQELIDRGGSLGDRAEKCLDWMYFGWPEDANLLIPPANVTKFLMQVDVESITRGSR